jgi:hypothetical protein
MIRNLAQCPYCGGCEIALDEAPSVALDPDGAAQPCSHLAWVDGRYAQWDRSPQGVNRVIGSTEFRWDPPEPGAAERTDALLPYLKELVNQGPGWAFAPPVPFALQTLCAEEKATDRRGKSFTLWDVDGWAVFAQDPAAFWAALPDCQERQLTALDLGEGERGP